MIDQNGVQHDYGFHGLAARFARRRFGLDSAPSLTLRVSMDCSARLPGGGHGRLCQLKAVRRRARATPRPALPGPPAAPATRPWKPIRPPTPGWPTHSGGRLDLRLDRDLDLFDQGQRRPLANHGLGLLDLLRRGQRRVWGSEYDIAVTHRHRQRDLCRRGVVANHHQ